MLEYGNLGIGNLFATQDARHHQYHHKEIELTHKLKEELFEFVPRDSFLGRKDIKKIFHVYPGYSQYKVGDLVRINFPPRVYDGIFEEIKENEN